MPQSKQRALSREIILSTALDLVDEEGLSALSLRSLGKRLGVSQAAFYRHFPDKAALLEGISEQVWRLTFEAFLARLQEGKVEVPGGSTAAAGVGATPPSRLMAYMREYAHCLAATLRSHPGTVMLVLTHPTSTPEQFSLLAGVFVQLARHGIAPEANVLALISAVSIYTTGFVAAEVVPPVGGAPERPIDLSTASAALSPDDAQVLRPLVEDVVAGRCDLRVQFAQGLEAILRGWA